MTGGYDGVRRSAPAKLNLRLRVLQQDEAGYHGVETLLLQLDLADSLELRPGPAGIRLELLGDPSVPADAGNLCWQAAEALCRKLDVEPALEIRLEKQVPSAAGLGGGSSDAAAVLSGLNEMLGHPADDTLLLEIAGEIGSDVPFGLAGSGMALGWERGRRLLPLRPPPALPALIAVPPLRIAARDAYAWLRRDRAAQEQSEEAQNSGGGFVLPAPESLADWRTLASIAVNDLEEPVFRRHPELRRLKEALAESGAVVAMLCGSGACVAAVFDVQQDRDTAAARLERDAGVRVVRTGTRGPVSG